jgi:hypothetical protein
VTYDNSTQIAHCSANSAARLIISRIDLPAFGDDVVYAEGQALGDKVPDDPTTIIRQRFYSFEIDTERQALRLNLHIFPTVADFFAHARGAHEGSSRVADLTRADMVPLTGCDVYSPGRVIISRAPWIVEPAPFPRPAWKTARIFIPGHRWI